jgi:single-strand DNA-binding protein
MSGYNRVILMGNLTRDPDLKQLPSGAFVAELGLASNETYKNQQGEAVSKPCFVDVAVWGKQAEACGQYLAKGRSVLVEGKLQLDQWESKEGQKRSRLRVRADRVQFMGRGGGGKNEAAASADQGKAASAAGGAMPF